jgi:hypothetical protein
VRWICSECCTYNIALLIMEITLEAIISFIGLFIGGGGGAFFTWR